MTTRTARGRRLSVYLFVVAAFVILAWRTELQDDNLRQAQYDSCIKRAENVARTNQLYDGIIRIERNNPYVATSPSTIRDRILLFQQAHLVPPDCGEKP